MQEIGIVNCRKCTHHLTNLDLVVCGKHYTFAAFDLSNRNN